MEQKRKILPLVYFFSALLIMALLRYLLPLPVFVPAPFNTGGVLPAAFGMVMTVMSAGEFKRAETGLVPFDEATSLVTHGFFRFTRNPMYLGMVLFLLGTSILLGALSTLLPIPFFVWVIHANFILGEERFMEAAFGEDYLAYKKKVRRWL
jgi:protein-S-isoprenylcysteine O-methyltransferase Ste14